MTLHRLVRTLGGDLYAGGYRANIPAPGHSAHDRSISLLLADGRLVIHGFGGTDWRAVRDWLRDAGFIDRDARLTGCSPAMASSPRPHPELRHDTACRLWAEGSTLQTGIAARRHLSRRALDEVSGLGNLRQHPGVPTAVYAWAGKTYPALMARISDDADRLTAVELTYLDPSGARACGLYLSRKTVGTVPIGAAVRLAPAAPEMLIGEGVVTTASAMRRFALPGWALRAAANLAAWTPPPGVRRVLIAADNGTVGLGAAERLRARLMNAGLIARVRAPQPGFVDWNAVDVAARQIGREEVGP